MVSALWFLGGKKPPPRPPTQDPPAPPPPAPESPPKPVAPGWDPKALIPMGNPSILKRPWKDEFGETHHGSGLRLDLFDVALADVNGVLQLPRTHLPACAWVRLEIDPGEVRTYGSLRDPRDPKLKGLVCHELVFHLSPGTKPLGSPWKLLLWGGDLAGNLFEGQTDAAIPVEFTMVQR